MTSVGHRGAWAKAVALCALGFLVGPKAASAESPQPQPTEVSPSRAEIVLNGLWRFRPAADAADAGPGSTAVTEWGEIWVPGDWRPAYNWPRSGLMPTVTRKGPVDFDATLERGVYARQINTPASWAGRDIILDLRRVSTDAKVWLDGQPCGEIAFPGGELDITALAKPGQAQELRIQVLATDSGQTSVYLEGTMGDSGQAARRVNIPHRGLVDDVLLVSRPRGPRVESVFIKPSVADKQLSLEVALRGPLPSAPLIARLAALDAKGAVSMSWEMTVEATTSSSGVSSLIAWEVKLPWENPDLWSPENPALYTLQIELIASPAAAEASADNAAQTVIDDFRQRFGFRDFKVSGRHFVLNGQTVRLRPTVAPTKYQDNPSADYKWGEGSYHTRETMRAALLALKRVGFNTIEEWPSGPVNRENLVFHDMMHELCDEIGLFVIAELPPMVTLARDGSWNDPSKRTSWERDTAAWIGRQRNHPSIIAWIHSPNFFGQNALTQGPGGLGQRKAMDLDNLTYQRTAAMGHAANAFIKKQDPTRPVTTHHGATVGDFLAVNTYLNFTPLQELEDWWADYAAHADMPFLAIEFEFPISYSFQGSRWLARNGGNGERFFTEWLASRLGEKVYGGEPEFIRKGHREHWTGDLKRWVNTHIFLREWDLWNRYPAFNGFMTESIRRQLRAQRTWGLDGGVIPWELNHLATGRPHGDERLDLGPFVPGQRGIYRESAPLSALDGAPPDGTSSPDGFAAALQPWLRPSLAWIAGGPEGFTRKDSRFYGGEKIEKQIVLVNDHQVPEPYSFKIWWDGAVSGESTVEGTLAPGEIKFLPVSFDAPEVETRAAGNIHLAGRIGPDTHEDTFAFSVWPEHPTAGGPAVMIFDPSGKTTAALEKLGASPTAWQPDEPLAQGATLVIGENALRDRPDLLARLPGLAAAGHSVLVSRQHPDCLRDGPEFRVGHIVCREAFPVNADHATLAGLEEEDFRDWRGTSTLVEQKPEYPAPDKHLDQPGEEPMHYRRSGTLGAVTSAPIEKPHLSGWRPILQTGFDLAYSPLMELDLGAGRIIWSTLDLEDNVPLDPAASQLAANLLAFLTAPAAPAARIAFLHASPVWAERLRELGAVVQPLPEAPVPKGAVVLLDPTLPVSPNVERFVEDGGRVLVLPFSDDPEGSPAMPFGVTVSRNMNFIGARSVPKWSAARGLSLSDLRYRTDFRTWLLSGGCEVGADGMLGRKKVGKGEVLFVMINPWRLNTEKVPALRTTRWRLTRAFNQVLANSGVRFNADEAAFDVTQRNRLWLRDGWRAKLTQRIESTGQPVADPGLSEEAKSAVAAEFDDTSWREVLLPAPYHHPGWWEYFGGEWRNADGEAVFRRAVNLPHAWSGKDLTLSLGRIADNDTVFFNGEEIGSSKGRTKARSYTIPGRLVRAGTNHLAVRVFNTGGRGGILGNPGSEFPGENSQVIDDALWIAPSESKPGRFLGLYHPDYRNDHGWGDDPYRYWKW